MIWETKTINLGEVKQGKKKTIHFGIVENTNDILRIQPGCSCTNAKLKGDVLEVEYTPQSVPVHKMKIGKYKAMSNIVIIYTDNRVDILTIKAIVTL